MKIIRKHTGFKKTEQGADGVLYCADDKGRDWYDIAHNAPKGEKALHILIGEGGEVVSVTDDITRLFPADYDLISVEAPASIQMGDLVEVVDGRVKVLPENPLRFAQEKARALGKVEARITQLERIKRLGMETPEELKELEELEIYSVHLMRAKGPKFPKSPIVC